MGRHSMRIREIRKALMHTFDADVTPHCRSNTDFLQHVFGLRAAAQGAEQ